MEYFHKMFYNIHPIEDRERMAANRYNFDSTIKTGLEIKPIDQPKVFELFFVPTNITINLIKKLMELDRELVDKFNRIPGIAQNKFMIEIITDELYSTNELEGVRSSRNEIAESTKSILEHKEPMTNRLNSMIKSYIELIDGDFMVPNTLEDLRGIYDKITEGEIKKEELPDGMLFRKDGNFVYRNGKEIHRGVYPESAIIKNMEALLKFMNGKDHELNPFIKIAISHYYFGYIHPFYDGNGRVGRFISSLYLRRELSLMTALSLSRGCSINRNNYLKIFDTTNKVASSGEVNYFVDEFLDIIITGQEDLLSGINNTKYLLDLAWDKVEKDTNIETGDERAVMFALLQDKFFGFNSKGMTVNEMTGVLSNSDVTVRKKLKAMEKKGLIERVKSNPLIYVIPKGYLE